MGSIAYVTTKPVHLQSGAFDSIDCETKEGYEEEFREEAPSLNFTRFRVFLSIT